MYSSRGHIGCSNILACKEKRGKVTELQDGLKTRMVTGFFACNFELQAVTEVTGEDAQWI